MTNNNEKAKAFRTAVISGTLRDLAIARGGTGDLRRPLTAKERDKRKARNKQARLSRRLNRKRK